MRKRIIACLTTLAVVLMLTSCSGAVVSESPAELATAPSVAPSPPLLPSPAPAPAQAFADTAGAEQCGTIVYLATKLARSVPEFSSVDILKSKDFFNFFLGLVTSNGMEQWYQEEKRACVVPVACVTAALDRYFDSYCFDPADAGYPFDKTSDTILAQRYSWDWDLIIEPESVQAVSDTLVAIDAVFYSLRETPSADSLRMRLIIKITDTGYHYISFERISPNP